jgi:hypothetical protein
LYDLLDSEGRDLSALARAKGVVTGDRRPRVEPGNDKWTEKLYAHPLINKLDDTVTFEKARLSHIDAEDFSRALLDIVWEEATVRVADGNDIPPANIGDAISRVKADFDGASPFLDDLEVFARQLNNDMDRVKDQVSSWFDSRMENLSKSYRKNSRWWLFLIGLVVAGVFNVDAISATSELYSDDALREAVAAQAVAVVTECTNVEDETVTNGEVDLDSGASEDAQPAAVTDPEVIECVDREVGKVAELLSLPVGHQGGFNLSFAGVIGWIIAAAALAQGAPFWFDALGRLSGLKKSLK